MMRIMLEKALAGILVLLFSATVITVVWQVIGRYVLEAPSSATEEIARFLLIWLGMVSMAYAFARRMHVGVDLISARLSPSGRISAARAIWLACAAFALIVMVYGGGLLVKVTATLGQTSAALGLPMWTIYGIMPVSGLVIAYFSFSFMLEGTATETENLEGEVQ
ncbi:TRAP transporter small permease [Altererythrobacter ishigakiensis]|uniref:TRAP transporter small permease protein n=1 Tax=Altererythrobacter ishigakiensis TaxID=476157 RepID=A0A562UM62_9SPHN|nr:TRAP transporter small permease [Altererythrobacter ishigakiensis]TWJ06676.1 TRAP-type C4-dicarboxylate transport system permease small subunit [Altererythrobacter ishigakiensis]